MAEKRAVKSHIYIDWGWVGDAPLYPYTPNASFRILEEHYWILPPEVRRAHDVVKAEQYKEWRKDREWARLFKLAWLTGEPLPLRREFGVTGGADTSRAKGMSDFASKENALRALLMAGPRGVTSIEARLLREMGGGISGALSKLHAAGAIACLDRTR